MSEIYRMEREGAAPPLPADGKCDHGKTKGVDDCRGEMCDECRKAAIRKEQAIEEAKIGRL